MKLTDLDAKLTEDQLSFCCPKCGEHHIVIPVGPMIKQSPPTWSVSGTVENATVRPSIDNSTMLAPTNVCNWHGFITDGKIIEVG